MGYDFLEQSTRLLQTAGKAGEINPDVMQLLAEPSRVTSFRIPVRMDDGSLRVFNAHRVRYTDALGPSRDGTRISTDLDLDEVKSLAMIMSIKHAAGNIPAGGGKGGIEADPSSLSEYELQQLCRGYMRNLRPKGPAYDVPGADIGTNLQTMAWMLDEYESITGYHAPPAVNDKPPILGGTLGGYEATGRGVFDVFGEAANELGLETAGARIAIQGFGQVGSVAATLFQEAGCKVIAVSDATGGVYREDGLDIREVLRHKEETGKLAGFTGAAEISNEELLALECEVLVPAAVQGVISEENVDRINTRLLLEAANAPTTIEADAILAERGVMVVPDVITNAGSVQLCQMERTQGLYDNYWNLETINQLRHERMIEGYRNARNTASRYQVTSIRTGAWINALLRLEEAIRTRGWC